MTFHAKAACISARPIPLATFRQHLLYSVCVTLLMAGPGFAQSVTPQPDNNPPLANQQNGNKTVGTGETLVINTGETVGNIILNGEKAWTTTESGIGGLANVFGQMSNGTVNKGGRLIVYAGGVAKDVAINDGGFAQTLDQGRISGTSTVNSGGILNVNAGGTAYDITVNDGGFAHILDQGRISGRSTVNMGGELYVNAGGTVKDVSVEGGNLWVEKDSKATGGITINGGKVDIIGEVTGKSTVNTGGKLHVNPHGTVKDVSVEGGYLWVQKDGKATGSITVNGGQADITVNGGQADITGEVTGKSTVNTGGKLAVDAGGAASDIIVSGNDSTQCTDDCSYLLVDGTSGDVTINNNGMLSGSGKIGNLTVHAGGAVSAGSGYDILGALTATGDATFDKGSIIQVNVANDGSRTNQFVVKGQANLSGGTVKLRSDDIFEIAADGTKILKYPSTEQIERLFQKTLVILTAEKGVTGRFDALTPQYDYNYITPSLTYTDKTVSLGVGLKNAAQIQDIVLVDAKTKNQKSVGSAIKSLGLGNPLLSTVLFSRKDEVLDYDALSGETHATLEGVLLHDAGLARDAVSDRVRAAFDGVAVKPVPTVALAYGPDAKKGSKAAGEAFVPLLPAVPTT
ncbi:hypothetical protein AB4Y96_21065, partial [Phyllobacterium sp. TAF24]|uniref:hypothetical protein n=1 Tax=Phyllobacterium sp. TAF24 TaxID=3233068 RepID=UPI003F982BE1